MVQTPLAFDYIKTRTICDSFDDAWAFLQGVSSDVTEPCNSLASRTILAKRIIHMADKGLRDVTKLRDDALAFLQHNASSADRKGQREKYRSPRSLARPAMGQSDCSPNASV